MTRLRRVQRAIAPSGLLFAFFAASSIEAMQAPDPNDPYAVASPAAVDPGTTRKRWIDASQPTSRPLDSLRIASRDTRQAPQDTTPAKDFAIERFVPLGASLLAQTADGSVLVGSAADTSWRSPDGRLPSTLEIFPVDTSTIVQNFVGSLRTTVLVKNDGGDLGFAEGPTLGATYLLFPTHMTFVDSQTGIVASATSQALRFTRDGGRTWSNPTPEAYSDNLQGPSWRRVQNLATDSLAFLAGSDGALARFDFRTGKLHRFASVPGRPLLAIQFTSAAHGVVADDSGFLHATFDSGATWKALRLDTASSFLVFDIAFADADHGFASGTDGAVLETRDGGTSWQRITRTEPVRSGSYRRLPPPLYYLLIALAVFVVRPALKRQTPRILHRGIGENLSSDKPLENASEDKLGLAVQANALTGFLMNPATKPPMTFAVLGEWGKGKSSFLRIARKGLDKNGYVTVWFNAWHHQSEESLLAALLDNIRRSELLGIHTLDGFFFRLRLTWRRILPHVPRVLVALAVSLLLFVSLRELLGRNPTEPEGSTDLFRLLSGDPSAIAELLHNLLGGTPLLLAAIAIWKAMRSVLVIFQTKPADLLASFSDGAKISDLSKKIGFREAFRKEFSEVANALADKPMVIFIDDLDRCRPQAVMATLEAINFLVTCGPCYFVIAMDKEQVSCAIISQDAAFIERFREENRSDKSYAQHYLEKLIQVELSVPQTDGKSFAALLKGTSPAAAPPSRDWSWIRRYLPVLLCAAFSVVCLALLAPKLKDATALTDSVTKVRTARTTTTDSVNKIPGDPLRRPLRAPVDSPAPSNLGTVPAARISAKPAFDSGKTDRFWSWMVPVSAVYLFLGFLVVAYFVWRERKARDEFVDSESFTNALNEWGELVHLAARTPRGAKTYINRLRYFATLRREWKLQWDAVQSLSTQPLPLPALPEDEDLVALSCLELSLRTLLDRPYELGPENLQLLVRWLEDPRQDRSDLAAQVRRYLEGKPDWEVRLEGFALLGAQVDKK